MPSGETAACEMRASRTRSRTPNGAAGSAAAVWALAGFYGSLGGVVILLTWLYLSSLIVLLGAVINAQSEKQTRVDSTEGPPKPMGQRGAVVADTLGGIRE